MRLKTNKTSKGICYYIIKSVYVNGKNTTKTYERLGYPDEIKKEHNCEDPEKWIQEHLKEVNEAEKDRKHINVLVPFSPYNKIPKGEDQAFNIGYLFLQKIYYGLRLDLVCKTITKRHGFQYNLNSILSRLIYCRILYPSSKLATCKFAKKLLEPPEFDYHHVERALSVLAEESDFIQAELYKYSSKLIPRKTGVLYYDCTNFFFEIEQEDPISNQEADEKDIVARKYAISKQHQPSPLVQMGLFMDYSGIPLAMCLSRGNKNEQQTLIPLEEKIMQDFELSKFVICTDAGLSSEVNRKFNNFGERSFVTTVSIKTMKKDLQKWCLDPDGWHLEGSSRVFNINKLDGIDDSSKYYNKVFYKETYVEGYDVERDIEFNQTLIVTFSFKYKNYLRNKRIVQIQKAINAMEKGDSALEKKTMNDYRRFVKRKATDKKGKEIQISYSLNEDKIAAEERFDGFYAVETNLVDSVHDILKINRGRWEIEESFRIMKNDFLARPVYASRSDRIKGHFLTCFIALLVYRILENKLGSDRFTTDEIISTLRDMQLTKAKDTGYIPSYTRSDLTDALHKISGFDTDYEIIRTKAMNGIISKSKKR